MREEEESDKYLLYRIFFSSPTHILKIHLIKIRKMNLRYVE